jgi:hypothetical protein
VSLVIKKYPDLGAAHWFYNNTVALRFSPSRWEWLREAPEGLLHVDGLRCEHRYVLRYDGWWRKCPTGRWHKPIWRSDAD